MVDTSRLSGVRKASKSGTKNVKNVTPSGGKNLRPRTQSYTPPANLPPQNLQRDPWGATSPDGQTQWSDGFGGGGGVGGGVIGINSLPPMSDEDYLAEDSQYQIQLAALMKALQDSTADFEAQKGRYDTSFNDSLRSLGWTQPMEDNPATPENEAAPGAWNREDLTTASGRSFQNQLNDFASRGLLQSSAYGRSQDDLFRSLNDQLGGMQGARTSFMDDIARQMASFQNQNTVEQHNARAEALARRAAGMAF